MPGFLISLDQNFLWKEGDWAPQLGAADKLRQARSLRARFVVPTGDNCETAKLGQIYLTIEASPESNFPDLNHAELQKWLPEVLKLML